MILILIIYMALGYWATGQTIYANKIIIYHQVGDLFMQRMIWGSIAGWVLIPWALLKLFFKRR